MKIVLFSIGNPGPITRHSAGHWVLQQLISVFNAKQLTKKAKYSITSMDNIYFVKSNVYMNESGDLLRQFLQGEKPGPCKVFVLFDDFDINLPKVRLRPIREKDSHNGIKSMARAMKDQVIEGYQLGVGIGPKPSNASRDTMARWVLSRFSEQEHAMLEDSMMALYKYVDVIISSEGEVGDCIKLNARITKAIVSANV